MKNAGESNNSYQIRTICSFGAGMCPCRDGLIAMVENGKITQVQADKEHPVSQGHTCAKGMTGWKVIYHPERITQPRTKTASGWKDLSWDEALDMAAERLGEVKRKYGPTAFGAANVFPEMSPVLMFSRALGAPTRCITWTCVRDHR